YFLRKFSARHGLKPIGFSTRLVNALLTYRFPGNIRELQNLIERGVIAAGDGEVMDLVHLAEAGEPLRAGGIGLTAEGRLDAPASEGAAPEAGEPLMVEPELADLQAFISGRERVLGTSLKEIEQRLVRLALERTGGNLTAAAQMLGMSRAQISY